jgi:hypothetical protein
MARPIADRRVERPGTTALPPPDLTAFTSAQITFAVSAWPMRAAEELRSALIFRALTQAARRVPALDAWTDRFAAMVVDELRHTRLCVTIGARLGAPAVAYDTAPVNARLAALPDPTRRAAAILLVEAAIGETISTMLFRAGRRGTSEPLSRAALTLILADEVRHQRNGWSALRALWPSLTGADRRWLQDEAASGLGMAERRIAWPALQWLEANRPFDRAWAALGVLPPETRVEAFYAAVERLVIPRLLALGLDGAGAWRDRYRPPAR